MDKKEMLAQALREYPTWGDAYIAAREREARWEAVAAERGVRMDEIQARAEDAETDAANARSSRDELLAEARERNEKLREALRAFRENCKCNHAHDAADRALSEGEG